MSTSGDDMHNFLNGLFPMSAEDRATWMLEQMLDGLTVGPSNKNSVRQYLIDHIKAAEAHARDSIKAENKPNSNF